MESAEALDDIDSSVAAGSYICEARLHAAQLGVPEEKACELLIALWTKGHDIAEAAVYPAGELLGPEEILCGSALFDVGFEVLVELLRVLHFVNGGLVIPFQRHFLAAALYAVYVALTASAEKFKYGKGGIVNRPACVADFEFCHF